MPPIPPTGGVNEREPTLIPDDSLQDCTGAEYRVGQPGIYVARGRDQIGDIGGDTGSGVYAAGFDAGDRLIVHAGRTYYSAPIAAALTFTAFHGAPSGTSAIVGTHYANRHYVANEVENRRLEYTASGVTSFPVGMSRSTYGIGTSVTQGAGNMSASTGLVYWVTEYDSARGIESMTGASVSTGAFASLDGVVVTVTGVSANPRANQIRWYRSTDGGGFPDGGLIATTAIGTTTITDTLIQTASLTVPQYGLITVGGLDFERDEPPPVLSFIGGPFQDSLLAAEPNDRSLRFTPAGFPDSWPSIYAIPFETERKDHIKAVVVLAGRIGVFCNDSVHVVYRLPRDSDSIFGPGEMSEPLTKARGTPSRRGATAFTPPGSGALAAWVSRDGIWVSNLTSAPAPVTDMLDWEGRVSVPNLDTCRLVDDPINRRLIFIHRRAADTTHNTGLWYLDYQEYPARGIRVTFADHGPIVDAATVIASDSSLRIMSLDSRVGNGQVYLESTQDADDSQLLDSAGSVRFRVRTKEFLPAGTRGFSKLGKATWMHDAGPARIEHRFFWNRRDDNPEMKLLPDSDSRNASDVYLGRDVNSFSLELHSVGTVGYGVHWLDVEGFDPSGTGGARKGA